MTIESVPAHLRSSYEMLKCAFPGSLPRDDYLILLSVLHGEFSQRNLAGLMAHCFGVDYPSALNDVYYVGSREYHPDSGAVERLKRHLLTCGYEAWQNEE